MKVRNWCYQLDFAYPIRIRLLDIESFLLVQCFNGCGESLLPDDVKTDAFRVGIGLVR